MTGQQIRLLVVAIALSASGVGYYFAGQSDVGWLPLLAIVAMVGLTMLFILELRNFGQPRSRFNSHILDPKSRTEHKTPSPRLLGTQTTDEVVAEIMERVRRRHGLTESGSGPSVTLTVPVRQEPANPVNGAMRTELGRDIKCLGLTRRTANILRAAEIDTVEDLASRWLVELLGLEGFGRKSLQEVRRQLKDKGFDLPR